MKSKKQKFSRQVIEDLRCDVRDINRALQAERCGLRLAIPATMALARVTDFFTTLPEPPAGLAVELRQVESFLAKNLYPPPLFSSPQPRDVRAEAQASLGVLQDYISTLELETDLTAICATADVPPSAG